MLPTRGIIFYSTTQLFYKNILKNKFSYFMIIYFTISGCKSSSKNTFLEKSLNKEGKQIGILFEKRDDFEIVWLEFGNKDFQGKYEVFLRHS